MMRPREIHSSAFSFNLSHIIGTLLLIANLVCFSSTGWAENLRIGYIGSLTGDAGVIGSEIARTLEVAINQINEDGGINGTAVELIAEDDGYEVKRTLTAYESLKSRINSKVIFMSTYGGLFALGRRAEQDDIVVVDTLDCNDELIKTSRMHTCVATRTESIGEAFVQHIKAHGEGRVGVLYEQEAWFNFIVNNLKQQLGDRVVEVVAPVQAGDYRAEVLKLKGSKSEQVIFLGNDSMGKAVAQARDVGLKGQFYSIAGVMSPNFGALAGKSLNGMLVSNWLIPRNAAFSDFNQRYRNRYGSDVTLEFVAGPTRDATTLVFNALRKSLATGGGVAGAKIRNEMSDLREFDGITGRIKMDPDGAVRTIRETLFRYENGKLLGIH
jgi:branched-chain amino acid transport system substrate-binding protein